MYFIDCQDVFSSFFNFSFYTFFSIIYGRKKTIWKLVSDSSHWPNGERGIWTLAPVTRPTPLAGAPLQPLEYFSSESYYIKVFHVCQQLFLNYFLLLFWISQTATLIYYHISSCLSITFLKFFSKVIFKQNGERGIRTLAPVARPTPLAGAPLRPLEYYSRAKCVTLIQ